MKKLTLSVLVLSVLYALLATHCQRQEASFLQNDPITAIGHGEIRDENGKQLQVNAQVIKKIQAFYLQKVQSMIANDQTRRQIPSSEIEAKKALIYREVTDEILANALFMDWLIEKSQPLSEKSRLVNVNNTLRWEYVLKLQNQAQKPVDNRWAYGLNFDLAQKLEKNLGLEILKFTNKNGEDYCRECLEAGVPIPQNMFGPEWQYIGDIENEFLSPGLKAEIWMYEKDAPKGVCIALPRFPVGSDRAELFGVICLGTNTNKVCFFDNPRGEFFKRNEVVPFKRFVGGTDLVINNQGECSDCHAGENPYIVHPDQPAFASIINKLKSTGWYDPLVDASWAQNPGPTNMLAAVSSERQCNSCHVAGSAGRFPQISAELSGYCNTVLQGATAPGSTMPPGGNRNLYLNHINALLAACGNPPTDPGVVVEVETPEDKPFLSPPIVFGPVYACATAVQVRGAVLDAKVNLLVNGTVVQTISPARNPEKIDFSGLNPLVAGDKIEAQQEHNGSVSALSPPVIVKNYKDDYPSGLPAPTIDPTLVYECANVIAVRHLQGTIITVYSNGMDPISYTSGGDWTALAPKKQPFDIGDKFTVKVSLCGDDSPMSEAVITVGAPASLPPAKFNPPTLYVGQELANIHQLTNGTFTEIIKIGSGPIGKFSTPISWENNFDFKKSALGRPVAGGDQFVIFQQLCGLKIETEPPGIAECREIPAPRIDHPIVGANYVVVTNAIPGARIRVYDAANNEIGDGSGFVILLNRAITGTDQLTIVQQVGDCTSRQGYVIFVRNSKSKGKEEEKDN